MRRTSSASDTSFRSVARSPRSLRDRNSMSLMITRSRSNSSRFDCSVRSIRSTVRSRLVSATWVWPIRMLTGVRSSCATSALNASSRA